MPRELTSSAETAEKELLQYLNRKEGCSLDKLTLTLCNSSSCLADLENSLMNDPPKGMTDQEIELFV
jgi:hypothetical protein